MMRKILPVAVVTAVLLFVPAGRSFAESGHGGGSHGGGSHGGGSHGGGSHGGGSHGGGSHGGGSHGGGSHGGSSHGGGSHGGSHGGGSHGGDWHGGSHHGGSHGDGHHHGHHGRGWIVYPGPFWYGWGWDCPYGDDCYGYGPGDGPWYGGGSGPEYAPVPGADSEGWSTVDIEVSPDLARVYLDGRYIGVSSDFDGDPDYLHLRPGKYKLEFRLEGFLPWSLDADVEAGAKIEVSKKLHRGSGDEAPHISPAPEPEGGVRYFWGKEGGSLEAEPGDADDDRAGRDSDDDGDAEGSPESSPEEFAESRDPDGPAANDLRHGAKLALSIEPPDAVVYLDGHFLGTAAEVSGADRGVPLTPGKHTISVLRPGSKDRTEVIDVAEGETKRLEITLRD